MRPRLTLILGGARSGKSAFAVRRVPRRAMPILIATAEAKDAEMRDRILRHRRERSPAWRTVEEPIRLEETVARWCGRGRYVVVDCLTLWLANLLDREGAENRSGRSPVVERALHDFFSAVKRGRGGEIVVVSNEVGAGIVPETALGRRFRDLAGWVNQEVARIADEVYWVTAGIPIRIKPPEDRRR